MCETVWWPLDRCVGQLCIIGYSWEKLCNSVPCAEKFRIFQLLKTARKRQHTRGEGVQISAEARRKTMFFLVTCFSVTSCSDYLHLWRSGQYTNWCRILASLSALICSGDAANLLFLSLQQKCSGILLQLRTFYPRRMWSFK